MIKTSEQINLLLLRNLKYADLTEDEKKEIINEIIVRFEHYISTGSISGKERRPDYIFTSVPDENITIKEMISYGYHAYDMSPVTPETAKKLLKHITIYALHPDDTEERIKSIEKIREHVEQGEMLGVITDEWRHYIKCEEITRKFDEQVDEIRNRLKNN